MAETLLELFDASKEMVSRQEIRDGLNQILRTAETN